eukprot:764740-Hanusia_phi.AAC.3
MRVPVDVPQDTLAVVRHRCKLRPRIVPAEPVHAACLVDERPVPQQTAPEPPPPHVANAVQINYEDEVKDAGRGRRNRPE